MQKKYGKEGFVVLSVHVDDPEASDYAETVQKAREFLEKQKTPFLNLILDEKPAFWHEKLRFKAVPSVYVFNREGKWTQFADEVNHEDVEKLVIELLKKK